MKRIGLVLSAVVLLAGTTGCPSGGHSPDVQGAINTTYYTNGYVHVWGDVVNVGDDYASNVRVAFRLTDAASGAALCSFTVNIGTVLENERRDFNRWYGCPPTRGKFHSNHEILWD